MKKSKLNSLQLSLIGGLLMLVVLLSSTLASQDYTKYKSKMTRAQNFDVTLIEEFDAMTSLEIDESAKKEISVKNEGNVPAFIRLTLKEFMEIGGEITYSNQRFMLDTDGNYVQYPTEEQAKLAYPNNNTSLQTEYYSGTSAWYIETKKDDENGQYGKYMALGYSETKMVSIKNGKEDLDIDHSSDTEENDLAYTTKVWNFSNENSEKFRGFFSLDIGVYDVDYLYIDDWDGVATPKWIIDKRDVTNGFVYWGQPLNPNSRTNNFVRSATLKKQPIGSYNYYLKSKMEAVSGGDMWPEAPTKVQNLFSITVSATNGVTTARQGDKLQMIADVDNVRWSINGHTRADTSIDKDTGILTLYEFETLGGNIVVTAISNNNSRIRGRYTLKVVPGYEISKLSIETIPSGVRTIGRGYNRYQQFSASIICELGNSTPCPTSANSKVDWSITSTGHKKGTSINYRGVLYIDENEEIGTRVRVKATSIGHITESIAEMEMIVVLNVGEKFFADGYDWKVLKKDIDGNVLITSATVITDSRGTKYNLKQDMGNTYQGSNLDLYLKDWTTPANLPTLYNRIQPVTGVYASDGNGETSRVLKGGSNKNAFSLSFTEYNDKYSFSNDFLRSADYASWTRTPQAWPNPHPDNNLYAKYIEAFGSLSYINVDGNNYSVRPAFWITSY